MVDFFREAVKPYGGSVYALNSTSDAVGMWVADESAVCPLIYDSHYADFLLDYCRKNKIDVVISLFDIELPILSTLKDRFASHSIKILVGDKWLTTIANDKWKTQIFLKEHGFFSAPTYLSVEGFLSDHDKSLARFPVYVKPRWGMGSISVFKAEDIEELHFFYNKVKREIENSYLKYESAEDIIHSVLIQESLPGEEYGLDVINDLEGNYQTTIIKRKLAMRSGETDAAITVNEPELAAIGQRLANICRHPANMDVDVFYDGKKAFILEINPRFGGGYPFSHAAGVNLPKAIIKWLKGEKVLMDECLKVTFDVKSMKGITIIPEKVVKTFVHGEKTILFYDGSCGFCHRVIQLSNKYLCSQSAVMFSPLQGETAQGIRLYYNTFPLNNDAIVLFDRGTVFVGPSAFFKLSCYFKKPWSWFAIFRFMPSFISDYVYQVIAKNRYNIFGKKDYCSLPDNSFRHRFLP